MRRSARILRWLPDYAEMSGFLRFAANSVASAEVQKRRPLGYANLFYLSNKDSVIARRMGLHDSAVQVGERVGQNRHSTFHLFVTYVEATGGVGVAFGIGEKLR